MPHAPVRVPGLTDDQFKQALANALRYFDAKHHAVLAPEFAAELRDEGHIYMRRFRPTAYEMRAYPLGCYPAKCQQAACIMLMIQNNLVCSLPPRAVLSARSRVGDIFGCLIVMALL